MFDFWSFYASLLPLPPSSLNLCKLNNLKVLFPLAQAGSLNHTNPGLYMEPSSPLQPLTTINIPSQYPFPAFSRLFSVSFLATVPYPESLIMWVIELFLSCWDVCINTNLNSYTKFSVGNPSCFCLVTSTTTLYYRMKKFSRDPKVEITRKKVLPNVWNKLTTVS